jgi:Glycosyl transferase family 2.
MEAIEIITAFVLSLSFLLLVWSIKGVLLRPFKGKNAARVTIVVTAAENAKNLEHCLAGLYRLREDGGLRAEILIVDNGMSSETEQVAAALLRKYPSLVICRPNEITNILTRGIANGADR